METRASYFLVGLFVLTIMAGFVVATLWVVGFRDERMTTYRILFSSSVTGLQEGSAVRIRGVPVGTVSRIGIVRDDSSLIEVLVDVRPGTPIKTDTRASVQPQGITGLMFIQLTGGAREAAPLEAASGQRFPEIPSDPSAIETLITGAPQLLMQLVDISQRLQRVLSEENEKNVTTILTNFAAASKAVAGSTGGLDDLTRQAADALGAMRNVGTALDRLAGDLGKTTGRLTQGVDSTLTDLRSAAKGFERLATELERITRDARQPMRDFTQVGLYELSQLMVEARALVQRLSRISVQFERDPARFLFGDQTRGVEPR